MLPFLSRLFSVTATRAPASGPLRRGERQRLKAPIVAQLIFRHRQPLGLEPHVKRLAVGLAAGNPVHALKGHSHAPAAEHHAFRVRVPLVIVAAARPRRRIGPHPESAKTGRPALRCRAALRQKTRTPCRPRPETSRRRQRTGTPRTRRNHACPRPFPDRRQIPAGRTASRSEPILNRSIGKDLDVDKRQLPACLFRLRLCAQQRGQSQRGNKFESHLARAIRPDGAAAWSSNNAASCSVIAPASSSASTMVTARL